MSTTNPPSNGDGRISVVGGIVCTVEKVLYTPNTNRPSDDMEQLISPVFAHCAASFVGKVFLKIFTTIS